jgi:hypothetical protein
MSYRAPKGNVVTLNHTGAFTAPAGNTVTLNHLPGTFGLHRYWRVRTLITTAAGPTAYAEIQMRALPGGADQCVGGTPLSSTNSATAGFTTPANAFDDNTATAWASTNADGQTAWIGYDFGVPTDVTEIALTARSDASPTQTPTRFVLEWSDDGATWATEIGWTQSTAAWTLGATRTFTQTADASVPRIQVNKTTMQVVSGFNPNAIAINKTTLQVVTSPKRKWQPRVTFLF